jgi:RNA polymerase sigma-70 factor (ECF subfamily)
MSNSISELKKLPAGDHHLIVDFLHGNPEAFNQLLLQYKDQVFNLCYRMLENTSDAEDCAQETFVKVYLGLKGFKFKSGFKTWLYQIAVNTCKNKLASSEYRSRQNVIELDKPIQRFDDTIYLEIEAKTNSPESVVIEKETAAMIMSAINSLPPPEKILIVLCDIEGNSYDEIAAITGLKLGTVKSKLARARHHLRSKLEGVI